MKIIFLASCTSDTGIKLSLYSSAHCNCMAGLSEVCPHVAATLFALESAVRLVKSRTCTEVARQWGLPSNSAVKTGKVLFARGCETDFTSPDRKRKQCPTPEETSTGSAKSASRVPPVTPEEKQTFYENLHKSGVKCGVLSLIPKYCDSFIPKAVQLNLPAPLSSLYKSQYLQLSYPGLVEKCKEAYQELAVNQDQVQLLAIACI